MTGDSIRLSDLPRTVPQDPEAVKREQEVREATAEGLRAAQVGRGPTPEELASLAPTGRQLLDGPGGCVIEPGLLPRFEQPPDPQFGEVQRVGLRPGDVLVLHCDQRISRVVFEKLRRQFREQFPEHKVVILEKGMRLSVASPEDAVDSPA